MPMGSGCYSALSLFSYAAALHSSSFPGCLTSPTMKARLAASQMMSTEEPPLTYDEYLRQRTKQPNSRAQVTEATRDNSRSVTPEPVVASATVATDQTTWQVPGGGDDVYRNAILRGMQQLDTPTQPAAERYGTVSPLMDSARSVGATRHPEQPTMNQPLQSASSILQSSSPAERPTPLPQRNAVEIFFGPVDNLAQDPFGWLPRPTMPLRNKERKPVPPSFLPVTDGQEIPKNWVPTSVMSKFTAGFAVILLLAPSLLRLLDHYM